MQRMLICIFFILNAFSAAAVAQNQNSMGNCSPNIIGGNNKVICPNNSTEGSALDSILASIKPSKCPSLTEDQTRAAVSQLMQAQDRAGERGDRRLRVRFAQEALGLWLCLPDQADPWISEMRDVLIGALGTAEYQVGQTGEGCVLITHAYQSVRRHNNFEAQQLLMRFRCPAN